MADPSTVVQPADEPEQSLDKGLPTHAHLMVKMFEGVVQQNKRKPRKGERNEPANSQAKPQSKKFGSDLVCGEMKGRQWRLVAIGMPLGKKGSLEKDGRDRMMQRNIWKVVEML